MEGPPSFVGKLNPGEAYPPDFGVLHMNLDAQRLENKETGKAVGLSDHEYQLLWLLIRSKGKLIGRDEIMEFIYDDDDKDAPLSDVTSVVLFRLRDKLEAVAPGAFTIQSTKNLGVRLREGVHPVRENNWEPVPETELPGEREGEKPEA